MDSPAWSQIVLECTQVLFRGYHALDAADYQGVVAEFAEYGEWRRQGKTLAGRAAIVNELRARPVGRVTAHLIQNVAVDVLGDDRAQLKYHLLAYRHDHAAPTAGPAPIGQALSIALLEERMARVGERWLTVYRASRQIFA